VLRDSQSLSVFRSLARPNVSCAEWSPLAETVALATLEGSVLVWDVLEDQILLEKEFGLEISDLKFSPDGKTLVVLSKLQSFVAILALDSSRDVLFLPSPISSSSRCVQFSSHGRYCAIARRDLSGHKDIISILSTLDWKLVLDFFPDTEMMEGLSWCPDSLKLVVWDSPQKMNVLIYRAFGELVSGFVTKEVASMGIRALKWIRRGAVLAIDAYDDTFKLINVSTWMPFAEITLPSTVDTALVKVYFEEHDAKKKLFEYKTREGSIKMAELVKSENEGRRAFSCMEESASGRFLLLRRDSFPHVCFIWDLDRSCFDSVIVNLNPIKSVSWNPNGDVLFMVADSTKLYSWTHERCTVFEIPFRNFSAKAIKWSPDGRSLLTLDKNFFGCLCASTDWSTP